MTDQVLIVQVVYTEVDTSALSDRLLFDVIMYNASLDISL